MATNWWFKFEWEAWLGDRELMRCSLETQGFWIKCLCLMYEGDTYFLEGRPTALAGVLGIDPRKLTKCVDELATENAAEIVKKQGIVKIVSRRLLKAANLREYNKLAKRKQRKKKDVKDKSRGSSEDKSFKAPEDSSNEESFKREEAATPLAPTIPFAQPSKFDHPAIIAFEEIFLFKTGTNFAKAVGQTVDDLEVWTTLIQNKRAYADKSLEERKKVCNWILDEYQKRVKEKQNGQPIKNFREQRSEEKIADRNIVDAARQRIADRKLSGPNASDSVGQLRIVGSESDDGRKALTG